MEASGVSMMSRPDCRSPFFPDVADSAAAERHYRHSSSAYRDPLPPHHSSSGHHSHHQPRLYVEEMPLRPVCLCHSCNVARMETRSKAYTGYPLEAEWSATLQEQYYRRDYMAAKSYVDGHSSPHSFSIHTPVRRDADMMHNLSSPPSVSRMPKCSPQSSGFAATPPFFPKYPFTDNQINLCKWFPIRLPDAENPAAIALGGYRVSHTSDFVKTGVIVERMRKTALRTIDGVEVVLAGPLDMRMTVMNGFSETVADAFYSGFPLTWKRTLSDDAEITKLRANITSLARPGIECVPEASPEARAEPGKVPAENDAGEQNARATDKVGVASPLSNDRVSRPSTPVAAKPAAGETGPAASEPPVERAPLNRVDASEPGAEEETVAASEPIDEDVAAASLSAGEEARPWAAEEEAPVAAEASEEPGHEPRGNEMAEEMEAIEKQAAVVHMEVDGDPCPGVVDDPPEERPANPRKRSRSRPRARYGKKRKGRSKKSKVSNKEPEPMEEAEEPADKTDEQDQSDEQRQPISIADKADPTDPSEEQHQPTSVADEPDDQNPGKENEEQRQEEAPAMQRKKGNWYGKKRKGRSKKSKSNKEPEPMEEAEEPADKTDEQDQSDEQRQPTSVADKPDRTDDQDPSEEQRQPTSIADEPDEQNRGRESEEPRQEEFPAVQRKKATQRAKRSPLPPPLPTPRVTKDEVIEAYGLKTSRSGRLLVPPLAYWRNQTVARDKDGGIIAIFEGFEERPSDTGNFNFKPPTQKKAVKLQEKLCAAASESSLTSKTASKGRAPRRRNVR